MAIMLLDLGCRTKWYGVIDAAVSPPFHSPRYVYHPWPLSMRFIKIARLPMMPLLPHFSAHSVAVSAGTAVSSVTRAASTLVFSWSTVWLAVTLSLSVSEPTLDGLNHP